jgi:hypothetical protein
MLSGSTWDMILQQSLSLDGAILHTASLVVWPHLPLLTTIHQACDAIDISLKRKNRFAKARSALSFESYSWPAPSLTYSRLSSVRRQAQPVLYRLYRSTTQLPCALLPERAPGAQMFSVNPHDSVCVLCGASYYRYIWLPGTPGAL